MLDWLRNLHQPEYIAEMIGKGGVLVLFLIIFAETGLLAGFFLPGDSLLITAGVLCNPDNPYHMKALDIVTVNILLIIAAVVGDQTGFLLGRKVGDRVWEWPDGKLYKRKHMEEAHEFYMRHGALAIIGARYIPIMRTFVPFVAGAARMPYRSFVFWNIFGGVLWITSLLWAGFFLGGTPLAKKLDRIIVIVIFVSFLPLVFGFAKRWLNKRKAGASAEVESAGPKVETPTEG